MTVKKGQSIAFDASYDTWHNSTSGWYAERHPKYYFNSFELGSVSHGRNPSLGSGDTGGPFFLFKEEWNISAPTKSIGTFVGPVVFDGVAGGWGDYNPPPPIANLSDNTLNSMGTTAIARCLPTNPTADLATFVGELREGVPRAVGSTAFKEKVQVARSSGGEYLNLEFGWKPMVRDLQSFAHAIKHHNEIIAGYKAGSDKKIRRRYLFPQERSTTTGHGAFAHGQTGMFAFGTRTLNQESRAWFSGAFKYHVPVPEETLGTLRMYESYANKLLGARITPETVWNVSPWTWAADWFGTTGDVLHNISSLGQDGLVMQYGYMMSSSKQEEIMAATAQTGDFSTLVTKTTEYKQRRPATPYGFGFDMHALTGKQTAILVALGLSRT